VVATTARLAETLAGDWRKAAMFCAQFEITDAQFWGGVPASNGTPDSESSSD
jgi:hypothetical protein